MTGPGPIVVAVGHGLVLSWSRVGGVGVEYVDDVATDAATDVVTMATVAMTSSLSSLLSALSPYLPLPSPLSLSALLVCMLCTCMCTCMCRWVAEYKTLYTADTSGVIHAWDVEDMEEKYVSAFAAAFVAALLRCCCVAVRL